MDASLITLLADVPDTKPPPSALFWELWEKCEPSAEAAYKTPFLQQLEGGVLCPVTFGAFFVSDLWYLYKGAASYEVAVGRTKDQDLKEYLSYKKDHYKDYMEGFKKTWRIENPTVIAATDAARQYAELEEKVATTEHPIYTLIVMLPCSHLWAWLGEKMKDHVDGNVYGFWIKQNQHIGGAYKMGNFLHEYEKRNPGGIDHVKAVDVYARAMKMEKDNFGSP